MTKTINGTPAAEGSTGTDAGNEIGIEIMNDVAGRLGGPAIVEESADEPAAESTEEASDENAEDSNEESAEADENTEDAEATEEVEESEDAEDEEDKETEKEEPAAKIDTSKEVAAALKDLPEETRTRVQGVVDQIVGRVVGRERAEKDRLGQRVTTVTAELEAARKAQGPVQVAGVNPLFMVEDEAALEVEDEKFTKFIDWAEDHAAGVNLPDSESYDPAQPTFTADQIRQRKREILREQQKTVPAARKLLETRNAIEKNLRVLYPAAYDPKAPEYAAIENVLKTLPALRQFPDSRVIALRQYLGAQALAELIDQQKEKKPTDQKGKQVIEKPAKKKVPRAPGAGSPAKGSVLSPKNGKPAASEAVRKVMQDPGNRPALQNAVSDLIGSDLD